MEVKLERIDWENVKKSIEETIKRNTRDTLINEIMLKAATKELKKYPNAKQELCKGTPKGIQGLQRTP